MEKLNERVKILPILNKELQLVDFIEYRADFYIPVAMPDLKGNEFNYLADAFLSTWISSSGEYINNFESLLDDSNLNLMRDFIVNFISKIEPRQIVLSKQPRLL